MIAQLKRLVGAVPAAKILLVLCLYSVLVVLAQLTLFLAFQFLGAYAESADFTQYYVLFPAPVKSLRNRAFFVVSGRV